MLTYEYYICGWSTEVSLSNSLPFVEHMYLHYAIPGSANSRSKILLINWIFF